jgi:hypothetical protein
VQIYEGDELTAAFCRAEPLCPTIHYNSTFSNRLLWQE